MVRVGVDIAKQVVHVHAVDGAGRRVVARALKRDQFLPWCTQPLPAGCLVAMEGRGGKNDATDAAAICEAASRPQMRFVPIKTTVQQGLMALHAIREGFKQDRTARTNRIRGVLPGVLRASSASAS